MYMHCIADKTSYPYLRKSGATIWNTPLLGDILLHRNGANKYITTTKEKNIFLHL